MILEYYISLLTSKFTKLYQHKIGIMENQITSKFLYIKGGTYEYQKKYIA
jgi:hypothetical protein